MANQQTKVGGDEGSVEMPVNVADGDNTLRSDNEQKIVVHGLDGSYLMDKNKWPKLTLPSEAIETDPTEALTQEESGCVSRNENFWMSHRMFRDVGRGFQILIKKLIT